jgi:hypothetical protein
MWHRLLKNGLLPCSLRASPDPIESLGSQISFGLIQGSLDLEGALMPRTLSVDLRQRVLVA